MSAVDDCKERFFEITTRRVQPGEWSPWLALIHEVNRAAPETFGAPTFEGHTEIYPDATVTFLPNETTIKATTARGSKLLRDAVAALKAQGKKL